MYNKLLHFITYRLTVRRLRGKKCIKALINNYFPILLKVLERKKKIYIINSSLIFVIHSYMKLSTIFTQTGIIS